MTGLTAAPGALFPDPDPARDWLRQELSRPDYQESLVERVSRWFNDVIESVLTSSGAGGLNPVVALVLLALLAGGIAFALSRLRANPTVAPPDSLVFADAPQTAEEHRRRARTALEQEQWGDAVVEAVRALAAGLVERGLMPEQSGVTVHEISERAAGLYPGFRVRLEEMSYLFDATRYGGRPATEQPAREAVDLELELSTRSPVRDDLRGPVSAVPR